MQTLTFVPTLLSATSAAPDSLPCFRRRASRARLRRRRSGESFKFGCKATGNRVHPLLRYRKIRFIVAWFSLSPSPSLFHMCGQHAPHVASGSRYTLRSTLNAPSCLSYLSKITAKYPCSCTEVFWIVFWSRITDLLYTCAKVLSLHIVAL